MYCTFFGFSEKPFNITPDPAFIYLSKPHQEAFAHLLYGIDNHCGFIKIVGEVGTGKTTVLRTLLVRLDSKNYRSALIFNPCLSTIALMQSINREYGLGYKNLSEQELLEELNAFLLEQNAEGNTVVLVIDEAQNLKADVLEQIRLISNLETERDKLIQIVLVGQPELEKMLALPELRQLNQRMAVQCLLTPMDFADTRDYIRHRLSVAGGDSVNFSAGALRKVFEFSKGFPRLINIVCDRLLLLAYTRGTRDISSRVAAVAIKDIGKSENGTKPISVARVAAAICALVALSAVFAFSYSFIYTAVPVKAASRVVGNSVDSIRNELSQISEYSSAVGAFNAIVTQWKAAPLPVYHVPEEKVKLETMAAARSLQICSFSGSTGSLLRMDSPAILELSVPGIPGKRYLAVTAAERGSLLISPRIGVKSWIASADLDRVWEGRWHVLWKNVLNIPCSLRPGSKSESVARLQTLLRDVGVFNDRFTGIYDAATAAAVARFQSMKGIEADGMVGKQTLMLLYRSATGYFAPVLMSKGGAQGR